MALGTSESLEFLEFKVHKPSPWKDLKLEARHNILTDVKGEIDRNIIIVGEFNTPVTSMDRSSREKNCKSSRQPK